MKEQEFRCILRYRLGIPVFEADGPCPACGLHSDGLGDHAISCGSDGERIVRHNQLRDALFAAAASAALAPRKEERALLPGHGNKPADVLIPNWSHGLDTAFDVTVVNSLRSDYVERQAASPGFALQQTFQRKESQVGPACRE